MASEYVSFMLVFAVGISMVVGITISMQNLTSSVSQTSGEVALDKVIEQLKGTFVDGVNNVRQWNSYAAYESNIDISRLLVNKYSYELTVISISGTYYLVGKTTGSSVNITRSTSLNFNINDVKMNGTIISSNSNPYILFQKDVSGITVTLGNR